MNICKTCGKPVQIKWGSHGTTENYMRVIHDNEKCWKLVIVKVREVVPLV